MLYCWGARSVVSQRIPSSVGSLDNPTTCFAKRIVPPVVYAFRCMQEHLPANQAQPSRVTCGQPVFLAVTRVLPYGYLHAGTWSRIFPSYLGDQRRLV